MKKKLMAVLLGVSLIATMLAGCSGSQVPAAPAADAAVEEATDDTAAATDTAGGYELALVTDIGTIDDKSFNQGAWEGVKKYGEENNIKHNYYQPQEKTTDSYVETISLAIEGGAKLVVCPGYLFEEAIFIVQEQFPDVKFILLDGEPHNADYSEYKTGENVMPILYQEDEAGYLAGYAAVKDGLTKLGFMGGMAVPAVVRFGYGFVQGADAAAKELGTNIEMMYHYTGDFAATPEAQAMAASWYKGGTEVIFACGGAVGNSVMAAAEEAKSKVIGVDVDQSAESDTVITSALKMLSNSVYDGIKAYYDGSFPGGKTATFSAANNGVGLPMETTKFEKFTQADYDALYAKLSAGEVKINNAVEDSTTADLTLESTKVTYVD